VRFSKTGSAYSVVFIDKNGNTIDKLPNPVAITLPAKSIYDTVFASFAGGAENWGGQWDEQRGTILFTTPFSGRYEVLENNTNLSDISGLSDETRSAIQFMVSKGFLETRGEEFKPDENLTRYEFSSILVRMFFALDRNLNTSFTDVSPDSPYYALIASGEHEGILEGIGEKQFAGDRIMTREEAVTVAARTLVNKKDHTYPTTPEQYLSSYSDASDLADYARASDSSGRQEWAYRTRWKLCA